MCRGLRALGKEAWVCPNRDLTPRLAFLLEGLTAPDDFDAVLKALQDAKIPLVSAEITMIPQNYVELTDETAIKNLQKTLDLLDEDDDVQAVYHNWDE